MTKQISKLYNTPPSYGFLFVHRLSDMASIYNHYVSVTRAKSKLVIVKLNDYNANCFQTNLSQLFSKSGLKIGDVVSNL